MLDRVSPPQEEGNTSGVVDGVRRDAARVAQWAALARSNREFLPLPWTTVIAPIWARIMATGTTDRDGPVFPRPFQWSIRSRYPLREKMQLRASSRLSRTCSFMAKFRLPARKLNVKVEFVKNEKELMDRMKQQRRRKAFPDHLRLEQRQCEAFDADPETEEQAEEGDVDYRIPFARAGRPEAESARGGL